MQIKAANDLKVGDVVRVLRFGKWVLGEIHGNIESYPHTVYVDVWSYDLGLLKCMSTKFMRRVIYWKNPRENSVKGIPF